jgi:drug/metabolite transporter (DMT)-like permease
MRGRTAGTELSLVVAAILLGLNFVAIKIAVVSIPPLLVGALRFTAGGLLLLAVLWLVERPGRPTRGLVLTSLGLGLIGGTVFNAALNEGTRLTSASNAALIMATAPVWGMLLAAGLKVESLRKTSVVGALVSLLGVVLVLGRGLEEGGSSLAGDLLVFVAAVSFGAHNVLSRTQHDRYSPLTLASYATFIGGFLIFFLVPAEVARGDWETASLAAWAAVAYLAVFSTAVAYWIWQLGIARIGADRVLVYQYLITLVGVVSSVIVLNEAFGPLRMLGAAVILGGVYLASR